MGRLLLNFGFVLAAGAALPGCGLGGVRLADDGGPIFPAAKDGRFGYITRAGEWALPPTWEEAGQFDEGIARVRKNGLQGLINREGELIVPAQHEFLRDPKEGLAAFEVEGKVGFYNSEGIAVVPAELDLAEDFWNGAAKAVLGGKAGLMGPKGKWLVKPKWDDIGHLGQDGLFAFREGGKWGYRNLNGDSVIEPRFQNAGRFSEGLAAAAEGGVFGFIDRTGAWAIPPQFDQASAFTEERAVVAVGGKKWLINEKGLRQGQDWRRLGEVSEGLVFAESKDVSGYINLSGQMVAPVKALDGLPFREGLALISKSDSMAYVDRQGQTIWESAE